MRRKREYYKEDYSSYKKIGDILNGILGKTDDYEDITTFSLKHKTHNCDPNKYKTYVDLRLYCPTARIWFMNFEEYMCIEENNISRKSDINFKFIIKLPNNRYQRIQLITDNSLCVFNSSIGLLGLRARFKGLDEVHAIDIIDELQYHPKVGMRRFV